MVCKEGYIFTKHFTISKKPVNQRAKPFIHPANTLFRNPTFAPNITHFICMTRFWSNHVENSSERGCSVLDYEVQLKCLKTTDSHYYSSFILFINI